MYDENQLVKTKWNNNNKDRYIEKGYKFTKRYDEFQLKAKDLSPTSKVKVKATCDYCGSEYLSIFSTLHNNRENGWKDACGYCAGKKAQDVVYKTRAEKHFSKLEEVCKENNYELLTTINEYTSTKMIIKFVCSKHGIQEMMLDNLVRGHKCFECSYEIRFDNMRHSPEYVANKINSINNNILLNAEDYKNATFRNLRIKCNCGNIFCTSFSNYVKKEVNSCFSCSNKESKGEKRIRELLLKHNIKFIQEKRFDDCRDIKPLPFDFYLEDYNFIIEFDGRQHFEAVYNEENFNITQRHDKIKNQYCRDNNIVLLRIPYWESSCMEDLILEKFKTLNINKRYSLVT